MPGNSSGFCCQATDEGATGQNIDFQTTILSRFDMIFIVKDDHNEARDRVSPCSAPPAERAI